jgi:DNA modification methylase
MSIEPNLLCHCDCLQLLERVEDESCDLIYLDPPWLTNESADRDSYNELIFKVAQQAKRILKGTGNLFLYSRPDLNFDFHSILKEVFESKNFLLEYVIQSKSFSNNPLVHSHDTLLSYRKSDKSVYNKVFKTNINDIKKLFPGEDKKGLYTMLSPFKKIDVIALRTSWKGLFPPQGLTWRYSTEKMNTLYKEGLLVKDESENRFYIKKYLTSEDQLMPVGTIWDDINPVIKNGRTGEQNILLLERIVKIGSNENGVILDPFCGSGTMEEACLKLNRRFIACDNEIKAVTKTWERLNENNTTLLIDANELTVKPIVWNKYQNLNPTIEDEILSMIINGENYNTEFKESAIWNFHTGKKDDNNTRGIIKSVAAFLNSTTGGRLLIGVKNNKDLVDLGLDFEAANPNKKDRDGYELWFSDKITTLLGGSNIGKISISFYEINTCTICKLDVPPSSTPIFYEGAYYMRDGNKSKQLTAQEFYEVLDTRYQ